MKWTCKVCDKEFEFQKGCQVSYQGFKCKDCNEKETKEYLEDIKEKKDSQDRKIHNFKAFYDQSLGVYISSYSQKKEIEKTRGVTYVSNDERVAIQKEAKNNNKHKQKLYVRQNIEKIMENVRRGHSYIDQAKREGLL